MPDDDPIIFEVLVKVYLRHREEPLLCPTKLSLPAGKTNIAALMEFCTEVFLADFDSQSASVIALGDTKEDHRVLLKSDIQAIVLFAPERLPEGLVEDDE